MTTSQRIGFRRRVDQWIVCAVVSIVLTACRAVAPAPEKVVESRADWVLVPLQHAECTELADTINALLEAVRSLPPRSGFCAVGPPPSWPPQKPEVPRIIADPHSNSILIRASAEDLSHIVEMIRRFDAYRWEMREPVPN